MTHKTLEIIAKNSPHLSWITQNTLLVVKHGSMAYGTNIASSDEDFKGVTIPTKEYFFGSLKAFEQAELKDPDTVIYEIRKFFNLAMDNNPNLIETLHVDEGDIVHISKLGEKLIEHRNEFLSKRAKYSFAGYAIAQLKRIKTHRKHILTPPLKAPERKDFGLNSAPEISGDQLAAITASIQKELDKLNFNFIDHLDDGVKHEIKSKMLSILSDFQIDKDKQWLSCANKIGLNDNFIEILFKERQFFNAKKEWDQYVNWKNTRNKSRYALEEKFGYDCYVEETEFLTKSGWKKFDDILSTDKLATVYLGDAKHRKFMGVEYQSYEEKFDGTFSGNLYNLYGNHLNVLVTPNHKMIIQKEESFSKEKKDWCFEDASNLPDTFNIIRTISPNINNHCNSDVEAFNNLSIPQSAYLRLMGWYLSNGTISFETNGKIKSIDISQEKNGKLYSSMKKFSNKYKKNAQASLYEYIRAPNDYNPNIHVETILSVRNNDICEKIVKDCGETKEKKIPRWIFSLSKHQMEILLDAMMAGDGTKNRPDNSLIFYSSLKQLADDMQELALLCGFETSLYGPYVSTNENGKKLSMYQVHVNKTRTQFKKCIRAQNIKTMPVLNKRIVCFSVPNSTLITRLNGNVAIQGNCKHGLHLIRLLRMCKEIIESGKVLVKRPDAKELLEIRNGLWSYDKLLLEAEKLEKEIESAFITSSLPNVANKQKLDDLCVNLVEQSLFI